MLQELRYEYGVTHKGKNKRLGTGSHFFSKVAAGSQGILNDPGAIFSELRVTFIKSNIPQYFKGEIRYHLLYFKDKYKGLKL